MEKLSLVLWRERELLGLLSFKLEVERLLLASGDARWLGHATREIEDVLATIRETEVLRAVLVDELAAERRLPPNPSLAALAAAAPDPWGSLLLEHRDAFVATARTNARLAKEIDDLVDRHDAATPARTAAGEPMSSSLSTLEHTELAHVVLELRVQEIAHQAALLARSSVLQPSLLDFLR